MPKRTDIKENSDYQAPVPLSSGQAAEFELCQAHRRVWL